LAAGISACITACGPAQTPANRGFRPDFGFQFKALKINCFWFGFFAGTGKFILNKNLTL